MCADPRPLENSIDRTKLYVLLGALETDLRAILETWVLPFTSAEVALGDRAALLRERAVKDGRGSDSPEQLVDYLDFADAFSLINRNAAMVPDEDARIVRQFTPRLEQFVMPRNRVMHIRPLHDGDLEAGLRLCVELSESGLKLPSVRDLLRRIGNDPGWQPTGAIALPQATSVVHNLPIPEFDETGLVGRSSESQDLLNRLIKGRDPMITLVGEGGMGKTALCVSVLYELIDHPACPFDAVLWASLKSERLTGEGVKAITGAARDVIEIAVSAAGAIDADFNSGYEELGELLDGIKTLVVVDNVESANSNEIVAFYDAMPADCQFLLTSRVGLGQIERRINIGSLAPAAAAKMLRVLARRRGVRALAEMGQNNLEKQAIRLRGTPLAVRWYVESVAAGREPAAVLRDQTALLRFCLETIYRDLSEVARHCLSVLYASRASLDASQIAVITDVDADGLARALQDLQRRSLVEAELSGDDGLHQTYRLTAATAHYLSSVDRPAGDVVRDAEDRLRELRASEESRQRRGGHDIMHAHYVQVFDDQQKPVAHLLRQAMKVAKRDFAEAKARIERARGLAPDFFEVDRVEGFALSYTHPEAADDAYARAIELAPDDVSKARCNYFYAWLLGNQLREPTRAVEAARQAHNVLGLPATACRLGQSLMYLEDFDAAEEVLRQALSDDDHRSTLIARTQLGSLAKRRVENLAKSRQALAAVEVGSKALRELGAYLDTGVADATLRRQALRLAVEIMRAGRDCPDLEPAASALAVAIDYSTRQIRDLLSSEDQTGWLIQSGRILQREDVPEAMALSLRNIEEQLQTSSDDQAHGIVHNFDRVKGFGFVTVPVLDDRVFFHRQGMRDETEAILLTAGTPVQLTLTHEDGRTRGELVSVALTDEEIRAALKKRRLTVIRREETFVFSRDMDTGTSVYAHRSDLGGCWSQLVEGQEYEADIRIGGRGPILEDAGSVVFDR